jgi:hypothetical protein
VVSRSRESRIRSIIPRPGNRSRAEGSAAAVVAVAESNPAWEG